MQIRKSQVRASPSVDWVLTTHDTRRQSRGLAGFRAGQRLNTAPADVPESAMEDFLARLDLGPVAESDAFPGLNAGGCAKRAGDHRQREKREVAAVGPPLLVRTIRQLSNTAHAARNPSDVLEQPMTLLLRTRPPSAASASHRLGSGLEREDSARVPACCGAPVLGERPPVGRCPADAFERASCEPQRALQTPQGPCRHLRRERGFDFDRGAREPQQSRLPRGQDGRRFQERPLLRR
jgi:hypothetical protein